MKRSPPRLLLAILSALLLGCLDEVPDQRLSPTPPTTQADDDDSAPPMDPLGALPPCEGGLLSAISESLSTAPEAGSAGWHPPGDDTTTMLLRSMEELHDGQALLARTTALLGGYELCRGDGDERGTALWRPSVDGVGRLLLAWRGTDATEAIVEVPHPLSEARSFALGLRLFSEASAQALLVAGAHRCANEGSSGCGQGENVCGGPDFRESDVAHSPSSLFHAAHVALAERYAEHWIVGLHGMDEQGLSLSAGTTVLLEASGAMARVAGALEAALPETEVTACSNWPGSTVLGADRHCHVTNIQARHASGTPDVCDTEPPQDFSRSVLLTLGPDLGGPDEALLEALAGSLPGP